MSNDYMNEITSVIFKRDKEGVAAVFPFEPSSTLSPNLMSCYAHVGQHSSCSLEWLRTTRTVHPETDSEAAFLRSELESIGYQLRVLRRIPRQASELRTRVWRQYLHD